MGPMNRWSLALALAVGLLLPAAVRTAAGEKKADTAIKIEGELTKDDPTDKVRTDSYHKVHKVKLVGGKTYRIDLMSKQFDCFMRLEDSDGKQLAMDDDGGEGFNSRIIHKAERDGEYRIIATSLPPEETGKYTLTITEASPQDILEGRARNIGDASPEEQKEILTALQKNLAERAARLTERDVELAMHTARSLEDGPKEQAADAYLALAKSLEGAADKKIADIAKMFVGASRRVRLPGNQMELKATSIDGKEIDLKNYRGKVVLVDFWATWCRPCRAELPNVKKLYETYKDKGFEVIGVSVDRKKKDLDRFLEKDKLPWVTVHDHKADSDTQPLAEYYGVMTIPMPILVDREGRVVSMDALGDELERLLQKHLGGKSDEK